VSRIYLVPDGGEIGRRRALLPRESFVEAWPDLYTPGLAWIGDEAKALLDGAGGPLPAFLSLDAADVPIYYGPRLADLGSLPVEDSVRARALSGHGMAAAWITLDQFGERNLYQAQSPQDPVFVLRRPRGDVAHRWRLFRTREEAVTFMGEFYGNDPEAQEWARSLALERYEDLIERRGRKEGAPPA
jgi:hypothetical protein